MAYLPTLSTNGWIETVDGKADYLMSYFLTSQYSQSYLYRGHVASLPYIVAVYGHDGIELKLRINNQLSELFDPFFDEVDLSVEVTLVDENSYDIRVICTFIENNVRYDLAHLIKSSGGVINKIIKLSNG